MKKSLITGIFLTVCAFEMNAQSIDFDFSGRNSSEVTETNYIAWPIGRVNSDSKTFDNGVSITVKPTENATALASNWNKSSVQGGLKLLGDGFFVCNLEDGNYIWVKEGRTAVTLTISGLSVGTHSVLAYHNNTDGGLTLPDIEVSVDGQVKQTGVKYTSKASKVSEAGISFVEFEVAEGKSVAITYATIPQDGVAYTRTSVMLNGLEIDVNPYGISDALPANNDFHAGADDGSIPFSWTPATGAIAHSLVLGTDSIEVANATTYQYEGAEAAWSMTGLSPLTKYWWRVDEKDADGNVYKGKVLCFQPRRLAFPGAEGYGRFAVGGRGGVVYHVTTLEDNGDDANPIEGSFRYGIKKVSGPRTIVFDVAGAIYLKSRLTCSDKFVTIAGQTAPGNGVMFRGAPFGMASDGITRFLRTRRGHILDENDANIGLDGFGMAGNDHSIMDHCSISWTIDEAFSSRSGQNITLQRTLISEALNIAGHPNYPAGTGHGYAATIGGGERGSLAGTYHHNLLAHNQGRNWSLSGGLDGAGYYDGHHDIFNNVVYNWAKRATDGGTHELNFVNNYYKMGPATSQKLLLRHQFEGTGMGTQSAYVSGNIREELNGNKTRDKENETYRYELSGGQVLDWKPWSAEPFFPSYATIETAEAAYLNTLSDVGCNQPAIDNHDKRMIDETLHRTTSTEGAKSKMKGIIDHEDESEGFDYDKLGIVEAKRDSGWDTDGDGIPDWFEQVVGTDVNTANNNQDRDGDYYTDLEEYLNWLAEPHFVLAKGEELSIDLSPYFAGYQDFSVIDNGERATDGFIYNYNASQMTVQDVFGSRLRVVYVTVKDNASGITFTRPFHFAVIDDAAGITTVNMERENDCAVYDLSGRKLDKAQRGLNIQHGIKFIKQ